MKGLVQALQMHLMLRLYHLHQTFTKVISFYLGETAQLAWASPIITNTTCAVGASKRRILNYTLYSEW